MMRAVRTWKILLFVSLLTNVAHAQSGSPPPQVGPRDFAIMAFDGSPSDAEQLRGMKDAGLNISGFCRAQDVERVSAAGLACFVNDPRASGYDWEKLPPEKQIRASVRELAGQVEPFAAALGFYLRDEPGVVLMPGLGRVATLLRESLPDRWASCQSLSDIPRVLSSSACGTMRSTCARQLN